MAFSAGIANTVYKIKVYVNIHVFCFCNQLQRCVRKGVCNGAFPDAHVHAGMQ